MTVLQFSSEWTNFQGAISSLLGCWQEAQKLSESQSHPSHPLGPSGTGP